MSYEVEQEEYRGYTIKVVYDPDPMNPYYEYDQVSTLLYGHKRYSWDGCVSVDEWESEYIEAYGEEPTSWDDWEKFVREHRGATCVRPVYLYDHSGLAVRIGSESGNNPFTCKWDSGLLGLVFDTEEGRKRTGCDPETGWEGSMSDVLEADIADFHQYVSGTVYGYEIDSPDGESFDGDSLWDMFGGIEEYVLPEARSAVDWEIRWRQEQAEKIGRMVAL